MKKEQSIRRAVFTGVILLLMLIVMPSAPRSRVSAKEKVLFSGTGYSPWKGGADVNKKKSSMGSVKSGYYTKKLNKQGKKIYKALLKKNRNSSKKVRVNLSKKVKLKVSGSYYRSGKIWDHKKMQKLDLICDQAVTALLDSNIDFYWIGSYSWRYYYHYYWNSSNKITVMIDYISLKPNQWYKNSRKEFGSVKNTAKAVAASVMKRRPDRSRFTTVRLIFEYLVKTVTYGYNGGKEYSPASALLAKYRRVSVCDGYSRAFKMICNYCGVPCLYVGSEYDEHAWNMVQLESGKWYGIDVTWGDNGSIVNYRWFMYGRNEVTSRAHPGCAINMSDNNFYRFDLPVLAPTGLKYRRAV